MASDKQYRTVVGFVQFDPREAQANGKDIRSIRVRQAGFGPTAVVVSATLWPSHGHVQVEKGDFVALEGTYTQGSGTKEDGTAVKYHNLSVTQIVVLGKGDTGQKVEVENESADEVDEDDIPF